MKYLLSLLVIASIASCKKESSSPEASSSNIQSIAADTVTHYIGESFGGGIVFYVNATGRHGLIAAESDLEEPSVWSYTDTLTNAGYSKIGAGHFNTNKIFRVQGDPGSQSEDYAALECFEFEAGGYTRWYLPSKDELNELFKQKNIVGGFKPFAYWSSTEIELGKAWFQNFGTGKQVKSLKLASYAIRPIRYF